MSNPISRRSFLTMAGLGVALGSTGISGTGVERQALDRLASLADPTSAYQSLTGAPDPDLILVTVQLAGGLDFLNTVVPLYSNRYRDIRGSGAIDPSSTSQLDADFGLAHLPYLADRWKAGELGIVHGVGHTEASLSHFEETELWERGSADPEVGTGWLGRALDSFAGPGADPLLGVGVGGLSPSLYAPGWNPVAIPDDGRLPWTAAFIEEHPALVRGFTELMMGQGTPLDATSQLPLSERVRRSQNLVRSVAGEIDSASPLSEIAERLASIYESESEEGAATVDTGLVGLRLSMVADLINGGLPTRAYHLVHDGFDTHADQEAELPRLLAQLDGALRNFDETLGETRKRVVVATWTEFGRRPEFNGSGTDHGTAGTQFVMGPRAVGGHHGEPVSLDRLDDDGNVMVTTDYRNYLGGLVAGTLGVDSSDVLPGSNALGLIA